MPVVMQPLWPSMQGGMRQVTAQNWVAMWSPGEGPEPELGRLWCHAGVAVAAELSAAAEEAAGRSMCLSVGFIAARQEASAQLHQILTHSLQPLLAPHPARPCCSSSGNKRGDP